MRADFARYGLEDYRIVIGIVEILSALALIAGMNSPLLLAASSALLCAAMLFACFVRLKVRDGVVRSLPAFFYLLLNGYIFIVSLQKL